MTGVDCRMDKSREKTFAKNTIILSIGTISSKIFTFFLLPLYTAVLTTEDYGNVDLLQSVIQLAIPIVTLQLSAAVFRYLIDKESLKSKTEIITGAFIIVAFNTIISIFVFSLFYIVYPFKYFMLFVWSFIASVCYKIIQSVVRGFGHNILYSVASFITVLSSLLVNLILILGFGFKGDSILIAFAISNFLASAVMYVKEKMWRYFSFYAFSRTQMKELLQYSLPLIPNEISWWIANTSDRFLIRFFLGSSFNGIYAAANKIPTIYTTIHSVFNLAWLESIARSVNDTDRDRFINEMIEKVYKFFVCLCLGIICCMTLAFRYLFGINYTDAYPHVYILTLAIFFNSMCAMYGGIFTAFKHSKIIGSSTVIGAIANIIINFLFIRFWGLYAASLSTLISYIIVYMIRVVKANKFVKLEWPVAFLIRALLAFCIVTVGYFIKNDLINIIIFFGMILWSFYENRTIIRGFISVFLSKFTRINNTR